MDEFQRRGTTFPININVKDSKLQFFALMDTGAIWNMQRQALCQPQDTPSEYREYLCKSQKPQEVTEIQTLYTMRKLMQSTVSSQHKYSKDSMGLPPEGTVQRKVTKVGQEEKLMMPTFQPLTCKSSEAFENSLPEGTAMRFSGLQYTKDSSTERHNPVKDSQELTDQHWCDISEVIESDFLISPCDIYPNRKVQLEDADIKDTTKAAFDLLCEQQHEAFSKNNKDIGYTQLIEMEINTGDSLPVAQSKYTLPLKHYDWVRQEIETLEKSGVIERSLSR